MENKNKATTEQERQALQTELSQHDKIITDYLHLFEMGNFPDDIALSLHKKFVNALHKRRFCKNRLFDLKAKAGAITSVQLIYNPRILVNEFSMYGEYLQAQK